MADTVPFKIGDTAQLKSGGPVMTVTGFGEVKGFVICSWFNALELKQGRFPPESLNAATPSAAT
jgi:uncharacterized protein YodC (DUF2158 family)